MIVVSKWQVLTERIDERMNEIMTEKEMNTVKMSTLYELRLIFTQGEKNEYTREEILELLDKIATTKD